MNPVPTTAAPISVIGFTTCLILAETVRRIRLLQVGLGGWGRDWAWRVIPQVDEVEVVGYVDSDPKSLAVLREEVPLAADICFASLLEERPLGDLSAVSIDFRRYSAGQANGRARHHTDEQPLLVDMSIHHFDLLRMLLKREPDRIFCESWNPKWSPFAGPAAAVASIDFGDDVVSYRGSWVSATPITPWAGEWRMEFERGEITWTSRDDNGALSDKVVVRPLNARPKTQRLPEMRVDRWGTLTEFANAIREGRQPEC